MPIKESTRIALSGVECAMDSREIMPQNSACSVK